MRTLGAISLKTSTSNLAITACLIIFNVPVLAGDGHADMTTFLYFAYGSNMYSARLRYRVGACPIRSIAELPGHRLCFHKRSKDRSAKCNALVTKATTDVVFGVVYEISSDKKPALDRAEGLGWGYHEQCLSVRSPDGQEFEVRLYVADPAAIDDNLKPYSWYRDFVLAGAEEHRLPLAYINDRIRAVPAIADPDRKRERSERAKIKR